LTLYGTIQQLNNKSVKLLNNQKVNHNIFIWNVSKPLFKHSNFSMELWQTNEWKWM